MYTFNVRVEFEDLDIYGILHHPKILYYCERARARFMLDNNATIDQLGFALVLRDVSIKFRDTIKMFDSIDIELRTKEIEKFSFKWDYLLKRDGKIMASCEIQMVTVDMTTKKLIAIPESFSATLGKIKI